MMEFRCLVVLADGRTDWRRVEAADPATAAALMHAEGHVPVDVRSGPMSLSERLNQPIRFTSRLGGTERALLMRQLAILIRSGLPVDRSLDLLREQAPKARQRQMLTEMLFRVRAGSGLAASLEDSLGFPRYVVGVIRSAEQSGQLEPALASLSARLALETALRRQLVTALAYPAAVLIATLSALLVVLLGIVPQFEPVFAGQEDRLPAITQGVLALSRGVRERGPELLAGGIILGTVGWLALKGLANSALSGRYRHRIPGMRLRDQYLAAELCGILALLIANGVRVVAALDLAHGAISSARWRRYVRATGEQVRAGERLSDALALEPLLPLTAARLIEVGERTGSLAETLARASEIMGEAARSRIERLVAIANPVAIVALGGIVALLIAGVMLGIFALGDLAG